MNIPYSWTLGEICPPNYDAIPPVIPPVQQEYIDSAIKVIKAKSRSRMLKNRLEEVMHPSILFAGGVLRCSSSS